MFGDTIANRRDSAGRQKPAGTADLWQERGNPMGKARAGPAKNVVGVFLWVFALAHGDGTAGVGMCEAGSGRVRCNAVRQKESQ